MTGTIPDRSARPESGAPSDTHSAGASQNPDNKSEPAGSRGSAQSTEAQSDSAGSGQPAKQTAAPDLLPSVSVPRGGGAIRGIDEKFSVTAATGTGGTAVKLPFSPGRSGFTPALRLSYDSGAGNGPFGFGWSLGVPAITRKTDKGLPQYCDLSLIHI